jgi:hypothetical protein
MSSSKRASRRRRWKRFARDIAAVRRLNKMLSNFRFDWVKFETQMSTALKAWVGAVGRAATLSGFSVRPVPPGNPGVSAPPPPAP